MLRLLEIAPRTIRTMLEYKCQWYGSSLVVVDDATHTPETCSECGRCGRPHRARPLRRSPCGGTSMPTLMRRGTSSPEASA